jgi:hypothetical protein
MELAVILLTIAAKYGPEAYAKAVEIAHKKDPTLADYNALLDILKAHPTGESYFLPVPT